MQICEVVVFGAFKEIDAEYYLPPPPPAEAEYTRVHIPTPRTDEQLAALGMDNIYMHAVEDTRVYQKLNDHHWNAADRLFDYNPRGGFWRGHSFSEDAVTLDMVVPTNVSLLRVRPTSFRSGQDGGTRLLEVQTGTPGEPVNVVDAGMTVNISEPRDGDSPADYQPQLLIDGDPTTCTKIPRPSSDMGYFRIDLGSRRDVKRIVVHNAGVDGQYILSVGDTVEAVDRHPEWNDAERCGAYRYFGFGSEGDVRYPFNEFYCEKTGRFLTLRTWLHDLELCEIEVVVHEQAEWTVLTTMELPPVFHLDDDDVPWIEHQLAQPVETRHLRLVSRTFYKQSPGLGAFQAWSAQPAPRFQIVNSQSSSTADHAPGLLMDLFWGQSGTSLADKLTHLQAEARGPPEIRTVVPQVDFIAESNSAPIEIAQDGRAYFGASASATAEQWVAFAVPFSVWPALTLNISERHLGAAETFTATAANISGQGFWLRVERTDAGAAGGWPAEIVAPGGRHALTVDWRTVAAFPPGRSKNSAGESYFAPTDNYFARLRGTLVSAEGGPHTLHLLADDYGYVLLDGKVVIAGHPDPTTWQNTIEELSADVVLEAGRHHELEIFYVEKCCSQRLLLQWSSPRFIKTAIPASALFHRRGPQCLSSPYRWQVVLADCDASNPDQYWRVDGGFLRSASVHHPDSDCLDGDNVEQALMSTCAPGGWATERAPDDAVWNPDNRYERSQWQSQLWRPVNGRLMLLSRRNTTVGDCDYRVYDSSTYTQTWKCEQEHAAPPHMCLSARATGRSDEYLQLAECGSGPNPELDWHLAPVTAVQGVEKVFDGAFAVYRDHRLNTGSSSPDALQPWPLQLDQQACVRGAPGDECAWACDGTCDTTSHIAEANICAAGTDSFDCDYDTKIKACAQACLANDECQSFNVGLWMVQDGYVNCYLIAAATAANPGRLYSDQSWTYYERLLPVGADPPPSLVPYTTPCELHSSMDTCPNTTCVWAPVNPAVIDDPICTDTNLGPGVVGGLPFACAFYKASDAVGDPSHLRTPYYSISPPPPPSPLCSRQCDLDVVLDQCKVTCEAEYLCPAAEFRCFAPEAVPTLAPTPAPTFECPQAFGVEVVNGRCRCRQGYRCKDGSEMCKTGTAGGGALQVAYFEPSCVGCTCIYDATSSWWDTHSTGTPTTSPTPGPTGVPTTSPTNRPTGAPTTAAPTTAAPTNAPTTAAPTKAPTDTPSSPPTVPPLGGAGSATGATSNSGGSSGGPALMIGVSLAVVALVAVLVGAVVYKRSVRDTRRVSHSDLYAGGRKAAGESPRAAAARGASATSVGPGGLDVPAKAAPTQTIGLDGGSPRGFRGAPWMVEDMSNSRGSQSSGEDKALWTGTASNPIYHVTSEEALDAIYSQGEGSSQSEGDTSSHDRSSLEDSVGADGGGGGAGGGAGASEDVGYVPLCEEGSSGSESGRRGSESGSRGSSSTLSAEEARDSVAELSRVMVGWEDGGDDDGPSPSAELGGEQGRGEDEGEGEGEDEDDEDEESYGFQPSRAPSVRLKSATLKSDFSEM